MEDVITPPFRGWLRRSTEPRSYREYLCNQKPAKSTKCRYDELAPFVGSTQKGAEVRILRSKHSDTTGTLWQWAEDVVAREPSSATTAGAKFRRLTKAWQDDSGVHSSTLKVAMHPAYQQMIGMGPEALPFLFEQLRSEGDEPNHWFWALAAITAENPVPKESRGRISEMAKAWLKWGRERGYVKLD